MKDKPSCEVCQNIYKKKRQEPPCENCKVELLDENKEAYRIFNATQNQAIILENTGKILDVNVSAVKDAMDMFEVKGNRGDIFDKVRKTFFEVLEAGNG